MTDIHKVAKEAGVSVATVSRVLNESPSVSDKTRTKVKSVIEQLNYEPNMLGRNLRSSRSRQILVLSPTTVSPFYSNIISGIENAAIQQDYNMLLCTTKSTYRLESTYFEMVKKKLVDGAVVIDPSSELYEYVTANPKYPVVVCGEFAGTDQVPCVSIDNETASYKAVKHLISLGHTKIAMLSSNIHTAGFRQKGFLRALRENGITVNEQWLLSADLGFESGQYKMRELLTMDDRPTAVFAVSDTIAIAALKAIKDFGLRSPQDIAVIGFDNIEFSAMTNPALTTISQPMHEMGVFAAKMLLKKIQQPEYTVKNMILNHELIIRESTMV